MRLKWYKFGLKVDKARGRISFLTFWFNKCYYELTLEVLETQAVNDLT